MTTRDTPFPPGTPCWVDLRTSDVPASVAFYSELFEWTPVESGEEFGGYVNFMSDRYAVAGLIGAPEDSSDPDAWTTYISTADIGVTTLAVADAGGQVVAPAMRVGDLGTMAIALDPARAVFGLWQPGTHIGFTKYNEPGSVTWDEHHSKDFAATTAFYERVFGWHTDRTSDTDEFRYYQAQIDGESVAGLMDSASFLPPDVPSHWAVYFSVSDVDHSVATASKLGGSVLRPPEDTPFGRITDLADPTGAPFKLHGPALADKS